MATEGHKITIYFSMIKFLVGLLTNKWATASWRLSIWHVRSPSLFSADFWKCSKISLFSTVLQLPWILLSVHQRVSVQSTNFVGKNSSNVLCSMLFINVLFQFRVDVSAKKPCCTKSVKHDINCRQNFLDGRVVEIFNFVCKVIMCVKK